MMKLLLLIVGGVLASLVVCLLLPIFFGAFIIAVVAAVGLFFGLWAAGVPISIKVNGHKTGTLRWFTFRPIGY